MLLMFTWSSINFSVKMTVLLPACGGLNGILVFLLCFIYVTTQNTDHRSWYLGCYHSNRSSTYFSSPILLNSSSLIISQCAHHCYLKSATIAAIHNASSCLCTSSHHLTPASSSLCHASCDSLPCGGQSVVSLYSAAGPYLVHASIFHMHVVAVGRSISFEADLLLADNPAAFTDVSNSSSLVLEWHFSDNTTFTQALTADNRRVQLVVQHTFTTHGKFSVDVFISNSISSLQVTSNITVVLPRPLNLQLVVVTPSRHLPSCVPAHLPQTGRPVFVNTTVVFEASLTMGDNLTFTWSITHDSGVKDTWVDRCRNISCVSGYRSHVFPSLGIYTVNVNVSNTLGWLESSMLIAVMSDTISSFNVQLTSPVVNKRLEVAQFAITMVTASRQDSYLVVNFGDGDVNQFSILTEEGRLLSGGNRANDSLFLMSSYGAGCTLHLQLDHEYSNEGQYVPLFHVFNNASKLHTQLNKSLVVLQELEGVSIVLSNFLVHNKQYNITAFVAVPSVNMTFDWSVQNAAGTYNVSTHNFYLPYNFTFLGQHSIFVSVWNLFGAATALSLVETLTPVEGLWMSTSAQRYVPSGTTIQALCGVTQGTRVSYRWFVNQRSLPGIVYGDEKRLANFTLMAGVYNITVEARNSLSGTNTSLPGGIIVQDLVSHLVVSSDPHVVLGHTVTLYMTSLHGTDIYYWLDVGDDHIWVPGPHSAHEPVSVSHTFTTAGLHTVKVHAFNNVSTISRVHYIYTEELVDGLALQSLASVVVGETVQLAVLSADMLCNRSDVLYTWGAQCSVSALPFCDMVFTQPGVYTINVTVSNIVSQLTLHHSVTVLAMSSNPRLTAASHIVEVGQSVLLTVKNFQSGVTSVVHYGDGMTESVGADQSQIIHTYLMPGVYMVRLGHLLAVVAVLEKVMEVAIDGPSILPLYNPPLTTKWTVLASSGSQLVFSWTCPDQATVMSRTPLALLKWTKAGTSNITLTVSNEISSSDILKEVFAQHPIIAASLVTPPVVNGSASELRFRVEGGANFTLEVASSDGASLRVAHNELTELENQRQSFSHSIMPIFRFKFNHVFPAIGEYEVKVNISNQVSWVVVNGVASVDEPITGVVLTARRVVPFNSGPVVATVNVASGNGLSFWWNLRSYRIRVQSTTNSSQAVYVFPATASLYTIKVDVVNALYTKPVAATIQVLVVQPMADLTLVWDDAYELQLLGGQWSTRNIVLTAKVEYGSNVLFTFDYGNGATQQVKGLMKDFFSSEVTGDGTPVFTSEGVYTIKVTASNPLGNLTASKTIQLLKKPVGLTISSSPSGGQHYGKPISFTARVQHGTNVAYWWQFGDGSQSVGAGPTVNHTFFEVGRYAVTCTASNLLDNSQVRKTLTTAIVQELQSVTITANGTLHETDAVVQFTAVYEPNVTGIVTEYLWDYGMENTFPPKSIATTSYIYTNPKSPYYVRVTASNPVSEVTSQLLAIHVIQPVGVVTITVGANNVVNSSLMFTASHYLGSDMTYDWSFGDGQKVTTLTLDTQHRYTSPGEYILQLVAHNLVSNYTVTQNVFVVERPCQPARIKILGSQRQTHKVLYSEVIRVEASLDIDCELTSVATSRWTIRHANGTGVNYPAITNQVLYMPARSLPYGDYVVQIEVKMNGTIVYSRAEISLTVQPSNIISIISGGIEREVGRNDTLTLNGSLSNDPDMTGMALRYNWSCSRLGSTESCFIRNSSDIHLTNNLTITFPARLLKPVGQFVFNLTTICGERSSWSTQVITVLGEESRLKLSVECVDCSDGVINSDKRLRLHSVCPDCSPYTVYDWQVNIIPSSSDIVIARANDYMKCVEPDGSTWLSLNYTNDPWELNTTTTAGTQVSLATTISTTTTTAHPMSGFVESPVNSGRKRDSDSLFNYNFSENSDIKEGGGGGRGQGSGQNQGQGNTGSVTTPPPNGGPVDPAVDGNHQGGFDEHILTETRYRIIIRADQTGTGLKNKSLVLKPGVLSQGRRYLVQVTASEPGASGRRGDAKVYFRINASPVKGRCTIFPTEGIEEETTFKVVCIGWQDDDKNLPLTYEVSYSTGDHLPNNLIYRGEQNEVQFSLPAASPAAVSQVLVHLSIRDNRAASTLVCSIPVNISRVHTHRSNVSELDRIYGKVFGSGSKLLAYQLQRDGRRVKTQVRLLATQMNHLDRSEAGLDVRRLLREALITSLAAFPYRDEYEVLQTASALLWTTAVPNELSEMFLLEAATLLRLLGRRMLELSIQQQFVSEDMLTLVTEISSHLLTAASTSENISAHAANVVVTNATQVIDTLLKAKLRYRVVGEAPVTRTTNHISVLASRYQTEYVPSLTLDDVHFLLPARLPDFLTMHAEECLGRTMSNSYQVHLMSYHHSPFLSVQHQIETKVAALSVHMADGLQIPIFNLPWSSAIGITLPRHTRQEIVSSNFTLFKHKMNMHQFNVSEQQLGQSLHMMLNLQQFNQGRLFKVALLIRYNSYPTNRDYDMKFVYGRDVNEIQLFFPAHTFNVSGQYHLGIVDDQFNAGRPRAGEIMSRDYNLTLWWTECVYWSEADRRWLGDGCHVLNTSTYDVIQCACNHLTAFGGHIARVAVSREHMKDYDVKMFFSLEENPVCIALVATVTLVYFLLLVLCCWVDKRHKKTETVIYLHDNEPSDLYKYEITLETGFRKGAGTTAKVSIVLHGDEAMSETRELVSEICGRKVFSRNSRDVFIMTLPESLGRVWKIQIWHNNGGSSPSWYLSRAVVRDCNTGHNFYFMCEKWFAVEEDDGKVEREIMALDESQLGFSQVFWSKGTQYLADYHLWTSLLTKPEYGTFTRAERLTVCFTLALMYMCINAIWYQMTEQMEYRGEFGLLDLSWYAVLVGVGCSLSIIPLGLLLALIFRRSNVKRPLQGGGVEEKYKSGKHSSEETSSDTYSVGVQPIMTQSLIDQSIIHWQSLQEWAQKQWEKRYQKSMSSSESVKPESRHELDQASSGFEDYMSQDHSHMISFSNHSSETKSDKSSVSQGKSSLVSSSSGSHVTGQPQVWYLPFWFRYVAWTLCLVISVTCGTVTIMYGFWFSRIKAVMWLQSLYFSLLVCVFISHPLMILLITVYTALRYRNNPAILNTKHPTYDSEDELEAIEKQQASRSLFFENCSELEKGVAARQRSRYLRFARPPQEKQLIKARKATMKEKKVYSMLWDIFGFIVLLFLLVVIAFGKDSQSAYYLNESVTRTFVHQGAPSFAQLETMDDWYTWSQTTMLDLLYTRGHHKDYLMPVLNGASVVVGCANIRQVRVKQESCHLDDHPNLPDTCRYDYSAYSRSTDQFHNWTYDTSHVNNDIIGTHGWYEGQGYVVELPLTRAAAFHLLKSLQMNSWIDLKTRAVMVEFTLFNVPTNLSTSVSLVYERPAIGKGSAYHRVKSVYLYRYINYADHLMLSCELLYILVIIIRLKNVCGRLLCLRKRFFFNPWNVLEVAFLTVSIVYTICFIYRFALIEETVERIRATYHEKYVDLSYVAFWDDLIKVLVGLMLFMTLFKVLQILRYHKMFARFGNVIRRASKDLLLFLLCFIVWLFAYSSLGVGLFTSASSNFRDLWTAMTTVSGMMVHGYDMRDTEEQRSVLTTLFLVTFMMSAFGMLFSYVVAILSYHYRDYKQEEILCMSPQEAATFLWSKLLLWCRLDEPSEPEEDDGELPAEFTMAEIEYQVDELLFKMNAITGSNQPIDKPPCYYTDSDGTYGVGDDGISSGGSEVRPFDEERFEKRIQQIEQNLCSHEPHLAQLIHLDSIGAGKLSEDKEKQLWSALELEIFRQLQLHRQENKPSSEYHSNSSGSYGNSGGDPYSGNSSPCLATVTSNFPRVSNLGSSYQDPSYSHEHGEVFMMTELKGGEHPAGGQDDICSNKDDESVTGSTQLDQQGAAYHDRTKRAARETVRTPSDVSTTSSEQHDVRPKLVKARPKSSSDQQSTMYTNYAYLCDSSSDSDGAKNKTRNEAKKTLRKTKSRGRGKGRHRLTEPDGLDELGVDNDAFSSEDDGKSHQAWM